MLRGLRSSGRGKGTSLIIWGLLGLLIVGLTGLGLGGAVSSLASQNVATVGDQKVSREDYVRTLLRQIDAVSQQTGQRLTMAQARVFGLDRDVLSFLVTEAALDGQVQELGISAGDRLVARELRNAQAFQGLSGGFDAQSYQFFLNREGMTAGEYENQLRADIARSLLQRTVSSGVSVPPVMARTVLAYDREARRFASVALRADPGAAPEQEPTDAALRAFYDENPDAYTTPETRLVTYVALLPEDLAAEVEISEEELRAAYDENASSFSRPERRVVDVIAFPSEEAAQDARARIDAGEISYSDLAEERGLTARDISLGPVTADTLGAAARDAVFGLAEPGVAGPVASDLGPALYRVNAIIGAESRSFEQVADELRRQLAAREAEDGINEWIDNVQDLLAAGATLAEIADETPLSLGEIGLTATPGEGLAGDMAFRREAFEAEPGEERDLIELSNGGIAALRVERVEPPALRPFEDVAEDVRRDWAAAERRRALIARAEALEARLADGATLEEVAAEEGLPVTSFGPLRRGEQTGGGLPGGTLDTVFDLPEGGTAVVEAADAVHLLQLREIIAADPQDPAHAADLDRLSRAIDAAVGNDLFDAYARMLVERAGVSVNETLIDSTLAQYP